MSLNKLKEKIEKIKREKYTQLKYFKPKKGLPVTFDFIPQIFEETKHKYQWDKKQHTTELIVLPCEIVHVTQSELQKDALMNEPKRFLYIGLYIICMERILQMCKQKNIELHDTELMKIRVHDLEITYGKLGASCKIKDITTKEIMYKDIPKSFDGIINEEDMRSL